MSPTLWKQSRDIPSKASPTWATDEHIRENDDCDLYWKYRGGSWEIDSQHADNIFYCAHCNERNRNNLRFIWHAYSMMRSGDWGEEFEVVCLTCKKYSLFSDSG